MLNYTRNSAGERHLNNARRSAPVRVHMHITTKAARGALNITTPAPLPKLPPLSPSLIFEATLNNSDEASEGQVGISRDRGRLIAISRMRER